MPVAGNVFGKYDTRNPLARRLVGRFLRELDALLDGLAPADLLGVVVTVPDEPLWRALNVARGAYVRERGNTPGHIHHWSRRAFAELLEPHGELVALRRCRPWLLAVVVRPSDAPAARRSAP